MLSVAIDAALEPRRVSDRSVIVQERREEGGMPREGQEGGGKCLTKTAGGAVDLARLEGGAAVGV